MLLNSIYRTSSADLASMSTDAYAEQGTFPNGAFNQNEIKGRIAAIRASIAVTKEIFRAPSTLTPGP